MPEQKIDRRLHFILTNTSQTEFFRHPNSIPHKTQIPELDRQLHGQSLLNQFASLKIRAAEGIQKQRDAGLERGLGIQIQFKSQPNVDLAFESLSRSRANIELLNVRHEEKENVTYATVFVPDGKLDVFEKIIQDYLADKRGKDGKSLDHKALVNTIREVRIATFEALYTDDSTVLPSDEKRAIWWEIWLPVRNNRDDTLTRFSTVATGIGFKLSSKVIKFPERTVLHMWGSKRQITQSMLLLNHVAEIRCAKETAEFFDSMILPDQSDWVNDLLERTKFTTEVAPYVCILDTGVNRGHPLLAPLIDAGDLHTNNAAWGTQDNHGHGSQMAGLALYGV